MLPSNTIQIIGGILGSTQPFVPTCMEDLILRISCNGCYIFHDPLINVKPTDYKYIDSVGTQLANGQNLTAKQRSLMKHIIKRYLSDFLAATGLDVTPIVENQVWRTPAKVIDQTRRIWADLTEKKIYAAFPYDEALVKQIQQFREQFRKLFFSYGSPSVAVWTYVGNDDSKSWVFELNELTVDFLSKFENFEYDDNFKDLVNQIQEYRDKKFEHIPALDYVNGSYVCVNSKIQPTTQSDDLIDALLSARRIGIKHCTSAVKLQLQGVTDAVYDYFTDHHPVQRPFRDLIDLSKLVEKCNFILVAIPAANELLHLTTLVRYFNSVGIENNQMSTMFRLDNSRHLHSDFNIYVKDNLLNTPLSNQTRVVFISEKLPKPLVEYTQMSKKDFDLVLTFGIISPHYLFKAYIKNHHNKIEFECLTKDPYLA